MRKRNRTVIKADRIDHVDVAKVHNPRYLVSRDGEEVGIFPGYNALMAINAARKIYGPGKYSSTKTGEALYLGRGALETERREREERTARAAAKAAAKRDKIQLPKKSRTRRNAEYNARVLDKRFEQVIRYAQSLTVPAEQKLVLKFAQRLNGLVKYNDKTYPNARTNQRFLGSLVTTTLNVLGKEETTVDTERAVTILSRAVQIILTDEGIREIKKGYAKPPVNYTRHEFFRWRRNKNPEGWRNEYDGAFNSMIFGTRHKKIIDLGRRKRGAERDLVMAYADDLLQLTMKNIAALDDGGLLAELSSKARTSAKRKHRIDPTRAALLLDQAEEIMLGGRRNPAEKDAAHPIEVTRHFRGGPPGYLSPWQKAMAIGQQELFDTGIKLAPRAAELRAARLSNPGATKPVYQSGLKQATAGQLPRLARVGLRVGRTPAEIRSDLATTGRFTAEQIRRAIDQATTAERRQNPTKRGRRNPASSWAEQVAESKRNFKRELKKNVAKANKLYALLLEYYASYGPEGAQRGAQIYIEDWLRKDLDGLKGQAFSEGLDYNIEKLEQSLEARRENPPVRQIFETFNGRPATRATSVQAPRRTPARVAQLGRLRLIRTADGRTWRFPGDRAPFLAADPRGKLHVVGGQYRANPAGEQCGEIEQIEYQTSKPHLGHDNETIYYHQLGEETGERPILEITPEGELQIVGGDYRIEADGIHN